MKTLSKPALKGLTIAASTVAVVELLKQDYSVGVSAAISWLLFFIASKKYLNETLNNSNLFFKWWLKGITYHKALLLAGSLET